MLTQKQIEERKNYIGGSDVAAVLGLSRWGSPLSVWMDKTEKAVKKEANLAMRIGSKLEDAVAEEFTEKTGKKVRRVNETIYHKDYPFIAANIDRKVEGEGAILECKTARDSKKWEWDDDEIPLEYIYQVMHYLMVTGHKKAYLAVLIGLNSDFKVKEITRDEAMIADMLAKEVDFWQNYVVPRVMPTTMTSLDGKILQEIYGIAPKNETIIAVDNKNDEVFRDLQETKKRISELEKHEKELENKLKLLIGDNTGIKTDTYQLKWIGIAETEIAAYTKKGFRKLSKIMEIK